MIQVFRFMGMPDKVLAFNELPDRFLQGFEMCRADGFPRHWKEWMGKIQKITKIPPEKDFLTGGVRRYEPIVEFDSFFYLVDFNLKQNEEKWQEVTNYVKQVVGKEVRLLEKLEDMALPLAPDKTSSVTLDPEEVPVIPIPKEIALVDEKPKPTVKIEKTIIQDAPLQEKEKKSDQIIKCEEEGCKFEAKGSYAKTSIRMHIRRSHNKEIAKEIVPA